MISIFVFCHRKKDADLLVDLCRYWTALTGDEKLSAKVVCEEAEKSGRRKGCSGTSFFSAAEGIKSGEPPDILLFELGQMGDLPLFTEVRRAFPDSALLLLTNPSLSPETYVTPFARPLAMLTHPLNSQKASEVIRRLYVYIYARRERYPQNLLICRKEERRYFRYSRILFMEAREKKIHLRYGREEYSFYGSLKKMETLLPVYFARCHRSYIINVLHMEKMDLSKHLCFMSEDVRIPVSKTYQNSIDALMKKV